MLLDAAAKVGVEGAAELLGDPNNGLEEVIYCDLHISLSSSSILLTDNSSQSFFGFSWTCHRSTKKLRSIQQTFQASLILW